MKKGVLCAKGKRIWDGANPGAREGGDEPRCRPLVLPHLTNVGISLKPELDGF